MFIKKYTSLILVLLLSANSFFMHAQCAMCKGTVQTSDYAKSINLGIEYMLIVPIVLISLIAYLWMKNKNKFLSKES